MNSEVAWVLVSSGTQVQSQIILDPDYLPDYISVSYDYVKMARKMLLLQMHNFVVSKIKRILTSD